MMAFAAPTCPLEFDYRTCPLQPPSAQIRLLDLYPSHHHHDGAELAKNDPLRCRVSVVDFPAPTPYKALSYVWGSAEKDYSIQIVQQIGGGGGPHMTLPVILITESLDTALRSIRSQTEMITLWIDQICINQNDNAEKSEQVLLMGSLYQRADQVLAWLGPAENGSDELMDAWREIGQAARDWGLESFYTRERFHLVTPMTQELNPADQETIGLQKLMARAAVVFAPLLSGLVFKKWMEREWFSRTWIVQEFCLCRDTVLACGTRVVAAELVMLGLHVLTFAAGNISRHGFQALAGLPLERLRELEDEPAGRLLSCRSKRQNFAAGRPGSAGHQLHVLLRMLFVGRGTKATYAQDRIVALLGLAVDSSELKIGKPDYGAAFGNEELLTRAARALIETGGKIDILCYSQFPKEPGLQGLPSWVPDWRPNLRPSFYTTEELTDPHLFFAAGPHRLVEALKHPAAEHPKVLRLKGYSVDIIEDVGRDVWADEKMDHDWFLRFFSQIDNIWRRSLEKVVRIYGEQTGRQKVEARWRVLIGDIYCTQTEGSRRATPDVVVRYKELVEYVQLLQEVHLLSGKEWKEAHEKLLARNRAGRTGDMFRASMSVMKGKRPFLTRLGYLGMGPAEARAGDKVVVFCGGRIPFVLRPKEASEELLSFIGESFCHGVMDGQAVTGGAKRVFSLV